MLFFMRKRYFYLVAVLFICFLFPQNSAAQETIPGSVSLPNATAQCPIPKTLRECYVLALKRSEKLAIQKEVIDEARGRFLKALSGVAPKASFVYSNKWQDIDETGGSLRPETPEAKFTLSQPLFTGFKEFAAIAAGKAEKKQRDYEFKRAQEHLFKDVSDAFYFFLGYQKDLEVLVTIGEILNERIEELNKREKIGRSRLSEVAGAQAQLRRLEAEMELLRGEMEMAGQLLEFLTGERIDQLNDEEKID